MCLESSPLCSQDTNKSPPLGLDCNLLSGEFMRLLSRTQCQVAQLSSPCCLQRAAPELKRHIQRLPIVCSARRLGCRCQACSTGQSPA